MFWVGFGLFVSFPAVSAGRCGRVQTLACTCMPTASGGREALQRGEGGWGLTASPKPLESFVKTHLWGCHLRVWFFFVCLIYSLKGEREPGGCESNLEMVSVQTLHPPLPYFTGLSLGFTVTAGLLGQATSERPVAWVPWWRGEG